MDPPDGDVFTVGRDICIPFNGAAMLNCTVVSGTPEVVYEWTVGDSPKVISREPIYNVTNPGTYNCRAINDFGVDMATSVVTGGLCYKSLTC